MFTHQNLAAKRKPRSAGVVSFDDLYMAMCFMVAGRSKDPDIQYGSVIVDNKKRIISIGYNGTLHTISDNEIDWSRINKAIFTSTAEQNAIDNCQTPWRLENAIIYTSGPPTARDVQRIINNKIRRIVYGPLIGKFHDRKDWEYVVELANLSKITLDRYAGNMNWIKDWIGLLESTKPEIFDQPLPSL